MTQQPTHDVTPTTAPAGDPAAAAPAVPGPGATHVVLFDLGRVLIRIANSWEHAYELAGLPPAEHHSGDISAGTRRKHDPEAERHFHGFETGRIDEDAFFAFAARTGGISEAQARDLMDAWLIEAYPGVDDLLDALKAAGHLTGCLSNTNARHWRTITTPGIPQYLPVLDMDLPMASHLAGHAKPAPTIYEHVEARVLAHAGLPPQRIVFFDDLAENVAAATARGWQAHVVTDRDHPVAQCAQSLREAALIQ